MSKDVLTFGSAVAGDLLSALGVPGGGTLAHLAGAFMEKRRKEAVDTFLSELSSGYHGSVQFAKEDLDPLVSILLRFSKAASDGAAIANLRLLSQVVIGLKKNKAMDDDNFRRWCAVLEHLTRAELLMIGIGILVDREVESEGAKREEFWKRVKTRMETGKYTYSETLSLAASVSRYGIFVPVSGYGGLNYEPTDWLRQLGSLVDSRVMTEGSGL